MKHGETYVTEERAREREREAFYAGYGRGYGAAYTGEHADVQSASAEHFQEGGELHFRREQTLKELADLGQEWEKG